MVTTKKYNPAVRTEKTKTTVVNAPAAKVATPRRDALLSENDMRVWRGSDYMNDAHLAFFRQRLMDLRTDLLENAAATSQHLQEQESTPDPADRATIEEESALELRTRDRERKLLLKIDATLRKIEDGSYGYCEDTGEPIGIQRLLARPTASLSVEAQERREQMKKQFAD